MPQVALALLREFWKGFPSQHDISSGAALTGGEIATADASSTSNTMASFGRKPAATIPAQEFRASSAGRQSAVSWSTRARASQIVIDEIAKVTRRCKQNKAGAFKSKPTRDSSTKFESWWIHRLLLPNHAEVVSRANNALAQCIAGEPFKLELESVQPDNKSETTQGRQTSFTDLWVNIKATFHSSGHIETLRVPVNVKHVAAHTSRGNSGGASMLRWAMLGDDKPVSKVSILSGEINTSMETLQPLPDSDYYFLVFFKASAPTDKPVGDFSVSSLLGIDPWKGMYYNAAQSAPHIQIHYGRARTAMVCTQSAAEARHRLWDWAQRHMRRTAAELTQVAGIGAVAPGAVLPATPLSKRRPLPDGYVLSKEDQADWDARCAAAR